MYDVLFRSLFEVVSFFNRPQQDKVLMERAGVTLEGALFPLLVRIGLHGSIGVGELAEQVNRDHSTVSRQVDKLIAQGLVGASVRSADRRVRRLSVTREGRAVVAKITAVRRVMMREALAGWPPEDVAQLGFVLERLAATLQDYAV